MIESEKELGMKKLAIFGECKALEQTCVEVKYFVLELLQQLVEAEAGICGDKRAENYIAILCLDQELFFDNVAYSYDVLVYDALSADFVLCIGDDLLIFVGVGDVRSLHLLLVHRQPAP